MKKAWNKLTEKSWKKPAKNLMKTRLRVIALILAWVVLTTGMGPDIVYAKEAQTSITEETISESMGTTPRLNSMESYVLPFSVQQSSLTASFRIVNEWQGGYQGEITLTNTTNTTINGWQMEFATDDAITNLWSCAILQNDASICAISAESYNSVIAPGESITIGYCALGANREVKGLEISVTLQKDPETEMSEVSADETEIRTNAPYVYQYDGFTVEYCIKNTWSQNCNICLKITNTSNTDIENWEIAWQSGDILSNAYNGILSSTDDIYTLKNMGYNQDILAGETIEVGFDVHYDVALDIPKGFALIFSEENLDSDSYEIENVVTNLWDGGYTGEIHVTNISNTIIEDWQFTMHSDDIIINVWNGILTDLGYGIYQIKSPQYYQNIQPGETIVIGYQIEGNNYDSMEFLLFNHRRGKTVGAGQEIENKDKTEEKEFNSENYIEILTPFDTISGEDTFLVEEVITTYEGVLNNLSLVEEAGYEVEDVFGNSLLSGKLLFEPEDGKWEIDDFGLAIGSNQVIFTICLKDGTEVEETFSYLNSCIENMDKTNIDLRDSDGDSINNYFESIFGTDPYKKDTDGDGLSDFEELMVVGTDPLVYDTDGNGIGDADEDPDGDGLTVLEEMTHGTSPLYSDSDLDGIDDKSEIFIIGTDPLKEDTDEDGLTDGEELKLGTNPLIKDTDGDGVFDGEEKIEQQVSMGTEGKDSAISEVSVRLACSGDLAKQLKIKNTIETDKLSAGVVGLVGFPIDINSMVSFDEAVITFHYDEDLLGATKEEDLCVLWYDEKNMQYVLLEDSVVDIANNTVSYTTTHFSTYLLVDKEIWLDAWRKDLNYDKGRTPATEGATYDIFLCIDYSVSEEELKQEKAFARKIIEQMAEGDRVKIGIYLPNTWNTYFRQKWDTSKKAALITLDTMEKELERQYQISLKPKGNYHSENYQAIQMITDMADKTSKNNKVGFLINAGKNEDVFRLIVVRNRTQAAADLKKLGFPVHSVSVTDKTNKELEALLQEYGGSSFNLTTLDKVERKYGYKTESFDMLDSDGDGLYDTYEVNGIRIQNGTVVYTDPYKADTDGDGISDFDEVGGLPEMLLVSLNQYASTINYLKSDPNDPNSTGKNIIDGYLVIKEFPYWPYSEKDYEDIFIKNTGKKDANGEKIYGLYNIYNSNPDELSWMEVERIRTLVEIECTLAELPMMLPAHFLQRYIKERDERNVYNCEGVLRRNKSARDQLADDAWGLMTAAEKYIEETGDPIVALAQAPTLKNDGLNLQIGNWYEEEKAFEFHPGDYLGIHLANTRAYGIVTFDGTKYIMNLRYYIFDYYNWDEIQTARLGLVSDSELYKMCRCGAARFYENWGEYMTQIIWEPTVESGQEALAAEKDKLTKFPELEW